jgi:Lrp/AsnC family transcriptional regulator for asnA, asnC and gidA
MVQNKTDQKFELDDLDKQILEILHEKADIPYTDVARLLSVSSGTIHVRMRRMLENGVVLNSRLVLNPNALGLGICAFIGIYLKDGTEYKHAKDSLLAIPEIIELHYITGNYSIFAKIRCKDTNHLMELLNQKVQRVEGVQRTETFISLEEIGPRPLPLNHV